MMNWCQQRCWMYPAILCKVATIHICLHLCYFFCNVTWLFSPIMWIENWYLIASLSLLLFKYAFQNISRCIYSLNIRWQHYSWWSIGLMLCFFGPWFGLHCNETYTVVSKDNTTDIWRRIWISCFHKDCWGVRKLVTSIWTVCTILMPENYNSLFKNISLSI